MPARVDHDQRRRTIIDGLLDVAARDGLHAVTLRAVAEAAGVSLRLVQYYFDDKNALLHAGLHHLEAMSNERWEERIVSLGPTATTREILETYFDEALPTDARSRRFHIVFTAYATLAITDPSLARTPFVEGPRRLQATVADLLKTACSAGEIDSDISPEREAQRLIAFEHGLGTGILIGLHTVESAHGLFRYHLDQLFTMNT
ncbi:TetR family transcriptional regulator C-terminal domain-containing protein [Gordonia sp. Z-3]|jgi:AcrR family transcriptional regulator|uniref:TetR family transcriptional regulator n=1 Tax=Gordonia tangerina TaxID=2911060 RepID=A0ABS9DQB6_9ACTN|nr:MULTISPECIES: TetR family transcriptional regulator C-terminal domain-containing protein [Gordonia]MCF3941420.1 TetR family transcriptional regulator [Gordonia tangerina]MED5801806.1 TetR family transcriptional regulator C-terminal domain-containing protein [Gordonia sp. Z-3]